MTESALPARPAWIDAELYPFRDHYLTIDGALIHYLDEGEGPPLLLLHGNPTWSFLYRDIIRMLRSKFRCIAPDYPGFGLSGTPPGYGFTPAEHAAVIAALVEKLDLTGIGMMIQDWGGPIGLAVAARQPERFHGFIIGNTWAWPVQGDWHFEWFSRLLGGPIGRFFILRFNAFVNLLIPLGVVRKRLTPAVMAMYRGPFNARQKRRPTYIFPREILHSQAFLHSVETGLAGLRDRPTLILWGDRDPAFRERERRRFETLFPNYRSQVLTGAGHFIQEDAPQEIATAIEHWWQSQFGL